MLSSLWNKLIRKSSTLARPDGWLRDAFGTLETTSGDPISPVAALSSSPVAACVRLLSESIASLPLHVNQRTATSKRRAPEHWLYRLLHDAPNDFQTSFTWRSQAMAHMLLHGDSYSLIERDERGRVAALWPIMPWEVMISGRVADGGLIYTHHGRGERREYSADQLLHLKLVTLDGIRGVSVLSMARNGIGLSMASERFGAKFFSRGLTARGLIEAPAQMSPDAKAALNNFLKRNGTGEQGMHELIPVDTGTKFHQLTISPEDAQFLQTRNFQVADIARWFRVPPHLIGDPSRLAYNSAETEMNAFLTHTLRPLMVNLETEMTRTLLAGDAEHFAEFDANGIARGDQQARYESYSKGLTAGFLTVNDVRRAENLPELDGGDVLMRPANMMAVGETTNAAN